MLDNRQQNKTKNDCNGNENNNTVDWKDKVNLRVCIRDSIGN